MHKFWKNVEPVVLEGRIKVPYAWNAGETASFYLTHLRDRKKIVGKKCPKCSKVLVPPRKSCPFCFVDTSEWVPLSGKGRVDTFTIVRRDTNIQPRKAPFAYAIINLEGADTGFVHILGDVDVEDIKTGMKVEAVFAEERSGLVTDIKYFRPIG